MSASRPHNQLTVFLSAGGQPVPGVEASWRAIPATRLLGRHLAWPRALRRLGAAAYFGPAGQLPLGSVGSPAVLTVHDLAIYLHPEWFPGRQPLSTRLAVPRSLRRADLLLAVSENTARDLVDLFHVGRDRIRVVHHGVSAAFRPLPADRKRAARERLGLPDRFILFVGTIEPRKNLETLLEAWSQLPRRPDLVLAGGWGWRYEAVRARLDRLGDQIHLLGPVEPSDLPDLYNLASCLAHPAWYEGFGLTPLEAMACGCPVVCSGSSSLPEVVGDAGLLVAPGDADAWRRAFERVRDDPDLPAELRRKGLLRAAEFTWEKAAAQTWTAIETVASPR